MFVWSQMSKVLLFMVSKYPQNDFITCKKVDLICKALYLWIENHCIFYYQLSRFVLFCSKFQGQNQDLNLKEKRKIFSFLQKLTTRWLIISTSSSLYRSNPVNFFLFFLKFQTRAKIWIEKCNREKKKIVWSNA